MLVVRFYKCLKWIAWHALRPLQLKDRWGFNLGEDLHDWATIRTFIYLTRVEEVAGFSRAQPTIGPRWINTSNNTTSAASTISITWKGMQQ